MALFTVDNLSDLLGSVGEELGPSDWNREIAEYNEHTALDNPDGLCKFTDFHFYSYMTLYRWHTHDEYTKNYYNDNMA